MSAHSAIALQKDMSKAECLPDIETRAFDEQLDTIVVSLEHLDHQELLSLAESLKASGLDEVPGNWQAVSEADLREQLRDVAVEMHNLRSERLRLFDVLVASVEIATIEKS